MHEVQDIQPHPFNHVLCRGVAARTGNVHLMYSNDRKLGQKGGARTPLKKTPSCSSRTPIFNQDHRNPTTSPQTLPLTQHSLDIIKAHTMMSVPFHHTLNTMAQPTSWVGGATPPPHNHQPFTSRQARDGRCTWVINQRARVWG